MTDQLSFGLLLARLLQHRELDIIGLSRGTRIPEAELQAVVDGLTPSPSLLRRLAPALELHLADLFVMAELAVPDDLAPVDPKASWMVPDLVWHAMRLQPGQRRRLRQYAQSLPQQDRPLQERIIPAYEQYPTGVGALIVRMLRNRNLDRLSSVKVLLSLTGVGPLSAATVGAVGHGRRRVSPELLAGFATVLAMPVDDLAALTGVELTHDTPPVNPAANDVAELIWDVRRLTASQMRSVCDEASGLISEQHDNSGSDT